MKTTLVVLIQLMFLTSWAQLRIDTTYTPTELVFKLLSTESSEIILKNISFTGNKQSIAYFENESPEELIDRGIMLSTGNVFDAIGPNKSIKTGVKGTGYRDNNLQAIATGVVTDAVVLEFDLLALRDSIVFEYVFASEEYPEFVDKGVNDVFGFFINEVGGKAVNPYNMARVPNSNKSVSIDNINHRVNEQYFLRSDFLDAHGFEFWQRNKRMMMRARIFEFDGFTVPLRAKIRLKEGKTYHLKIAIADVGDRIYDSAVMLRAYSFETKGDRIEKADSIVASLVNETMKQHLPDFKLSDELNFDLIVNFNTNESVILEKSFQELNDLAELLSRFNALNLKIIGHTDNVGNTNDNLTLSKLRAEAVQVYLINKGIDELRLSIDGKGESMPLFNNNSEKNKSKNRRVEFQLSY